MTVVLHWEIQKKPFETFLDLAHISPSQMKLGSTQYSSIYIHIYKNIIDASVNGYIQKSRLIL